MEVTITVSKSAWSKPIYTLLIDNEECSYSSASWALVDASCSSDSKGIFSSFDPEPSFKRDDTTVFADFGDTWDISRYPNPAAEIARRVALVNAAFEEVRESYERSFTVTL